MQQLPLGLRWPAHQRFDTYFPGDNGTAVAALQSAAVDADAPWVFVAGPAGSGKTHLLYAACHAARDAELSAQYLSLRALANGRGDAIRALGGSHLLALDDLDALAGDAAAQHALFDLFNRCRAEGASLLFTAPAAPKDIGIALPDLVSRLSSCTQMLLKPLDDAQRRHVLRSRAEARGVTLDESVLDFLFTRYARDLGSLGALLERLDRESMAARRRITVPFLRKLLESD